MSMMRFTLVYYLPLLFTLFTLDLINLRPYLPYAVDTQSVINSGLGMLR